MKIFDFIVHSSIYIAFGGACLVYASCLLFGVEPKIELMSIMFLTIYAIYNFGRITDKAEDEINVPDRFVVFTIYEVYLTASIPVSALIAILLAYYMGGIKLTLAVLIPLILIVVYGVKWIPESISRYRRLKEIPVVKNMMISLAWAWIATLLPVAYYAHLGSTITLWIVFVFIFWFTFIGSVIFDLRDIEGDKIEGIVTIPISLGFYRTIIFLIILNAFLGAFIILSTFNGWLPAFAYMLIGMTIYYYICMWLMTKMDKRFICDVLIDGDLFVITALVFLGSLLF